jgi:hypothetical protein
MLYDKYLKENCMEEKKVMFVVNIPFVFGSIRFPAARSIKILSAASRHTKIKSEVERCKTNFMRFRIFKFYLFLKERTFLFLERVLGHCHLNPHFLQESSKRSKFKIRPEICSNTTR